MTQQDFRQALKALRWPFVTLCTLTLLAACQSAPSPKSAVNAYLEALKSNDAKLEQEWSCHTSEAVKGSDRLSGVQDWEITGQERQTQEKDPDAHYDVVFAKVKSTAVGGFSVDQTWKLEVWNSNELFEQNKRFIAKVNQDLANMQETVKVAAQITGDKAPEFSPVMPDRKSISSKPYCVLVVEAAG